jgi:mevalonate kinase
MLGKYRKGSNAGMPIIAVVAVIGALAGMGVIFQVISGVGTETGQDHDRRQLTDLGSAIENKCEDLSSGSDATSITSIDVSVELQTDSELRPEDPEEDYNSKLVLEFSDSSQSYNLPSDDCKINIVNESIPTGQHQVQVSHNGYGNDNDDPIIKVRAN